MSKDLQSIALEKFFEFYKNDVETEVIDRNNVVISFPVHFSGFHRVEVTITQVDPGQFIISDGAKVIDELRMAGYALDKKLKSRLETISKAASIRVVKNHLVTSCSLEGLGSAMQSFLEAAKAIGDAYLVQRQAGARDLDLVGKVSSFLQERSLAFQTRHSLTGQYEKHTVDFYFPPNGGPGLALSIMNNPSKTAAEAWAFRSSDIQKTNERTKVGVVYDDGGITKTSKSILDGVLDVSIPSSDIPALQRSLSTIGIIKLA